MTVNSVEEAVKIINEREKPLAMYIFSAREGIIDLFTKNTSSGGICINDTIMHLGVEGRRWANGFMFNSYGH